MQVALHYKCHVTVGYPEITTEAPITQYNSTVTGTYTKSNDYLLQQDIYRTHA
jgi:hypothetical protein